MPDISCALDAIATDAACADLGGILTVYWAEDSDIDWDAMALEANYDDATKTILNWVMNGGATFKKLSFERKNGRLDALYTGDNGFYEVSLLNLVFKGHSAAKTLSLAKAVSCCKIVAQVFDNNGNARVIGKEFVQGAWIDALTPCKITRHLDTTGGFGNADDKNRDEFDITGEQSYPPVYSTVTLAELAA